MEIDEGVANDVLRAPKLGEKQFKQFAEERLVKGTKCFFNQMKQNRLKTGIVKAKKTSKAQTVMKEDCKSFGVIAAKTASLRVAFAPPYNIRSPSNC